VRPYGRPGISLLHRKSFFLTLVLNPILDSALPFRNPDIRSTLDREIVTRERREYRRRSVSLSSAPVEDGKDLLFASYDSLVNARRL
jgi:hypothetical protein